MVFGIYVVHITPDENNVSTADALPLRKLPREHTNIEAEINPMAHPPKKSLVEALRRKKKEQETPMKHYETPPL